MAQTVIKHCFAGTLFCPGSPSSNIEPIERIVIDDSAPIRIHCRPHHDITLIEQAVTGGSVEPTGYFAHASRGSLGAVVEVHSRDAAGVFRAMHANRALSARQLTKCLRAVNA